MKRSIAIASYASWCGLGFIRGTNSYTPEKEKPYLYSTSFIYGIWGTIYYANPALMPVLLYKEIYRLEINARNLEDEKKGSIYRDII